MKVPRMSATVLAAAVFLGGFACNQETSDKSEEHAEVAAEAFCEEHQIAEAQCPFCDPSLLESLRLATPATSENSTSGTAIIFKRFRNSVPTGLM